MTIILGLESSCDETAAALVTAEGKILAHRLATQEEAHRPYGGVVPEIAARAHVEALAPLIEAALADADLTLDQVDVIAATAGPGLIGGVMVGLVTGKALAHAVNKPLVAVNHLEGHALSPRLADPSLQFPYLLLLVSGGHCQLLHVRGPGDYARLATTMPAARRSIRPPSCLASATPEARRSSGLRQAAILRPFPCRVRWSERPNRTSPLPGSRAR